jgi:serine/threonine-protein phosphatase 2A regulatory subunit B
MEVKNESTSSKYKFTQVFGTNEAIEVLDEDIISRLKYDPTGKYLCLGDNAGRIIIFQVSESELTKDTN